MRNYERKTNQVQYSQKIFKSTINGIHINKEAIVTVAFGCRKFQ